MMKTSETVPDTQNPRRLGPLTSAIKLMISDMNQRGRRDEGNEERGNIESRHFLSISALIGVRMTRNQTRPSMHSKDVHSESMKDTKEY